MSTCSGKRGGGGEKEGSRPSSPQFPPVLISCLLFLSFAEPTIWQPGTGYLALKCSKFNSSEGIFHIAWNGRYKTQVTGHKSGQSAGHRVTLNKQR